MWGVLGETDYAVLCGAFYFGREPAQEHDGEHGAFETAPCVDATDRTSS